MKRTPDVTKMKFTSKKSSHLVSIRSSSGMACENFSECEHSHKRSTNVGVYANVLSYT